MRQGTITQELAQAYRDALPAFEAISAQHDGVSGPLLMSVPGGYYTCPVRLMIVGQQTMGWPNVTVGFDELLREYQKFDLGRRYNSSPFWQASHQLFRRLNVDGPERAFLWSNLVRVDQYCERPNAAIEDAVSGLGLLHRELYLLDPHVVVFFTGPNYDKRLRQTFPGIRFRETVKNVVQLEHDALPTSSFCTYHPKYLWLTKQRGTLDIIADTIRAT